MPGENSYDDTEVRDRVALAFSVESTRLEFIRKVCLTLMFQLVATSLVIALLMHVNGAFSNNFQKIPTWQTFAFVVSLVCMLVLICNQSEGQTAPNYYIFLFLFTLAEGFFLGVISSFFQIEWVLLSVGICSIVCFAITLFALQTKVDFTMMRGVQFVACAILLIFVILLIFIPFSNFFSLVYTCLGACLFSIYLIYKIQSMIDCKYRVPFKRTRKKRRMNAKEV